MAALKIFTAPLVLATFLSTFAIAAPAPYGIKPRAVVTNMVTETVWTTIRATTTVYVEDGGAPAESSPASVAGASRLALAPEEQPDSPPPTSAPPAPAPAPTDPPPPASSPSPGQFAETPAAPPPPASSVPPPATAPAPAAAPAPAPAAPAAPAPQVQSSGGSASGDCSGPGSSCLGDVTWYEGGLGACGTNVDTAGENAVALPVGFMGAASNSNPLCGKTIHVKSPSGTIATGIVKDKCMGCKDRAIDLTDKMFKEVTGGKGDGREAGYEWWLE